MFSTNPNDVTCLKHFRQGVFLLLLLVLLGLALQSFGTARAEAAQTIELANDSGPTGDYITLTGTNVYVCGNEKICSIVVENDYFFLNIGRVSLDQYNGFTWTGPLPRGGEFITGTALKTAKLPVGKISIGVGIPGNALTALDYTVTDNSDGPFSSATAWGKVDFRWYHTDSLVADGTVARSWLWGPQNIYAAFEPYKESPDGFRLVAYYDKARMEVNDYTSEDINSPYYVSNGLLVKEMVTDRIQMGDNTFEDNSAAPSVLPAGDLNEANRTPPYRAYASLLNTNGNSNGGTVNSYLFRTGEVEAMTAYNKYGVTAGHKVAETGHYIASPFWTYLNTTGPVIDLYGQEYLTHNARLFDPLFSATGLPITEPYWTTTMVGGVNKDVLVQLFERRVLTYTPSNSSAYQVEMGNVGLQYFQWRYGQN